MGKLCSEITLSLEKNRDRLPGGPTFEEVFAVDGN